jgi:polysaccharide export outer membrane protein
MIKLKNIVSILAVTGMMLFSVCSYAETIAENVKDNAYRVNPGDVIEINVWKEEGMLQDVVVRPDGGISFPLAGDVKVGNLTFSEIEKAISLKLRQYLADPVVTVAAKQLAGNKIYVIGQVKNPGEFPLNRYVDVMQALSMAGGMTPFAAVNDIIILRRDASGKQLAIEFEYGELEDGDELEQNVVMQAGDVVVVP